MAIESCRARGWSLCSVMLVDVTSDTLPRCKVMIDLLQKHAKTGPSNKQGVLATIETLHGCSDPNNTRIRETAKGLKSQCQIKDLFLMHYIRLLKPPQYSARPRNRAGSVSALITITSDLGDDFYFRDTVLTAEVLQESGDPRLVLASKEFYWKMGMRVLKIELNVAPSKHNFYDSIILAISSTAGGTPVADDISHPRDGGLEVITAYSPPFHPIDGENAEKFVQRRIMIDPSKTLRIWEETGESIARHIWYIL